MWEAVCLAGGLMLSQAGARAQGIPAASPVTGGQSTNPSPATSATPQGGAVPEASTNPEAAGVPQSATSASAQTESKLAPLKDNLFEFAGQPITAIRYEGVEFEATDRLKGELSQKAGEPLDPEKVRQTTRRLFATGRYRNIAVRVEREGAGLTLIFAGVPRFYVGRVQIAGVQEDRLASLLEYSTKLNPGSPFLNADVQTGTDAVKLALAQNGYYEPTVTATTVRDDAGQQVNVTYTVGVGPQARVGKVTIEGDDPGITLEEFRKRAKLKRGTRVTRDTASNALSNLRDRFQKKDRLEATVTLQRSTYDTATKTLNYDFMVQEGPIVKVEVVGAKLSKSRLHLLVPIYEEGTVDIDLLNEATFNMKDFLQQQGFFDAVVKVKQEKPATGAQTVLFQVDKGERHKVTAVEVHGNKYFGSELLKEGLKVQKADSYQRSGRFSQQLLTADEQSITSLYRANGFNNAKVTAKATDVTTTASGKPAKYASIAVNFNIVEGDQQEFGTIAMTGVDEKRQAVLRGLLQAQTGQPFSLLTLSGDRDAVLSYLLSDGFDQARIEVKQTPEAADKARTDIAYNVIQGKQVFTGKVLESGIHYTRPEVVAKQVTVHAGEPLNQGALLETQRNLYNLALFNEVVASVQNPAGDAEVKNVVVQVTEAKRWDVTYGFGFEVQTGLPACQYCTQQGTTAAQEGKAGASPRVSLDVSRLNLRGTDDTLTLHTTYGLLETVANLTFLDPHWYGRPKLSFQVSGGYSNVQDITTFAASTLQGDVRVTQKVGRKDSFIYNFEYRRVSVNPNSLAISASLIPLLSEPVRVAGPGITWFHDTRSPSPLDAEKGTYTSVQNFFASGKFGSQTNFNRTDVTNSTYYTFGKNKYVFARNTRVGVIASYGPNPNLLNPDGTPNVACEGGLVNTNASCNQVPLSERLYAGGATSIRGFGINDAGPRDLQTGYPVGGSAVFINTFELRLPASTLPVVGNSVSFVIFHDMGNVFQHYQDMFPSFLRVHQPNEQTCQNVSVLVGTCSFNYFSHDIGLGLRYKTPVGPIRLDLSYNLNPPSYPVITQESTPGHFYNNMPPYVGNAGHFNFFFSIGQSF